MPDLCSYVLMEFLTIILAIGQEKTVRRDEISRDASSDQNCWQQLRLPVRCQGEIYVQYMICVWPCIISVGKVV